MSIFMRRRLNPEKVRLLIKMREQGFPQKEIAKKLGISRWTVYWYSSEHGTSPELSHARFPPAPPRCMTCNDPLPPEKDHIGVRRFSFGASGAEKLKFCSWTCIMKYAERRAKMEIVK